MKNRSESSRILIVLRAIAGVLDGIPGRSSSTNEQHRCSGQIRPNSAALVFRVLWILEHQPQVFPDLCAQAPILREGQECAGLWLDLATIAQGVTDYAYQNFLREQSEAVIRSKEILDRIRLIAQNPDLLPEADSELRLGWALPAFRVLLRQRSREVLLRRIKAAGQEAKPKATQSPQQRARALRKADAKATLMQTLAGALRDRSKK